jgi:hypothetical protein
MTRRDRFIAAMLLLDFGPAVALGRLYDAHASRLRSKRAREARPCPPQNRESE